MFPDQYCVVVVEEQTFRDIFHHIYDGFLHFCIWPRVSFDGMVPGKWRNLLLSDHDGKNEIFGTTRDGLLAFVSVGFPSCCQESGIPHFDAHSSKIQYRMRIFEQLHVKMSAELSDVNPCLFRGTDDAIRCFGSPSDFGSLAWFFFPVGERTFSHHVQEAPLSTLHVHPVLRLL